MAKFWRAVFEYKQFGILANGSSYDTVTKIRTPPTLDPLVADSLCRKLDHLYRPVCEFSRCYVESIDLDTVPPPVVLPMPPEGY